MAKQKAPSAESDQNRLDLLPRAQGLRRTDDLLRAMLNTPPDPRVAPKPKKPKKRAKK